MELNHIGEKNEDNHNSHMSRLQEHKSSSENSLISFLAQTLQTSNCFHTLFFACVSQFIFEAKF